MVSTRPPTSKSSSPFNDLLVTVPKPPITFGTIFTPLRAFHITMSWWSLTWVLVIILLQVFSVFQDSTKYSGWSQQSRMVLILSLLPNCSNSLSKTFGDHSKCSNCNWNHRHTHILQLFYFSSKIQVFFYRFAFFFNFPSVIRPKGSNPQDDILFFWLINARSRLLTGITCYASISKISEHFMRLSL